MGNIYEILVLFRVPEKIINKNGNTIYCWYGPPRFFVSYEEGVDRVQFIFDAGDLAVAPIAAARRMLMDKKICHTWIWKLAPWAAE